jgi:2,4-dienoyl-CoA reductase (NADPH2)
VAETIEDFANCAALAREAGFDGVEIMGSEGYLITQFCASRTNTRSDEWGGSFAKRIRFPVEIMRRVRARVGDDFIVLFRLSALDLVEGGLTGAETIRLAREIEAAGADILSSGVGWHEARIPTIAHMVPRAAWRFAVRRLTRALAIPVVVSNRINTPETAEEALAAGDADLVAMARPLLADADFAAKAAAGEAARINSCIACNQACLDYIFRDRTATCLVNPAAGHELEPPPARAVTARRIAVVGAGPAGLACAVTAASRGHQVSLFEAAADIGGQLNLARVVPGKAEFNETLRYFRRRIADEGIDLHLGSRVEAPALAAGGFDAVVIATGVRPRSPAIPGAGHPMVVSYPDVLGGKAAIGERVAIIGCGGIGFDMAIFLAGGDIETTDAFLAWWGVDTGLETPGGVVTPPPASARRHVIMLQRSPGRVGRGLGLTTGWAVRAELIRRGVAMIPGVTYHRIDDDGLHYALDGEDQVLAVDNLVICAGQERERGLYDALEAHGITATAIGGAEEVAELDALRAIDQGTRLANTL